MRYDHPAWHYKKNWRNLRLLLFTSINTIITLFKKLFHLNLLNLFHFCVICNTWRLKTTQKMSLNSFLSLFFFFFFLSSTSPVCILGLAEQESKSHNDWPIKNSHWLVIQLHSTAANLLPLQVKTEMSRQAHQSIVWSSTPEEEKEALWASV